MNYFSLGLSLFSFFAGVTSGLLMRKMRRQMVELVDVNHKLFDRLLLLKEENDELRENLRKLEEGGHMQKVSHGFGWVVKPLGETEH